MEIHNEMATIRGDAQSRPEGTASLVSVCFTNTPLSLEDLKRILRLTRGLKEDPTAHQRT